MCPTLAVTSKMDNAMTMAAAVAFVLICANVIVSLIRGLLKPHLRILVFTLTIATFVTIADRLLQAFLFDMSRQLGPYIPLIIVNCIIICRCEVCASKQKVTTAFFDAVGTSLGFALAMATVATVREILGSGSWFGMDVMSHVCWFFQWVFSWFGYQTDLQWPNWAIMILPPGAFLTLGLLLGAGNWMTEAMENRQKSKVKRMENQ